MRSINMCTTDSWFRWLMISTIIMLVTQSVVIANIETPIQSAERRYRNNQSKDGRRILTEMFANIAKYHKELSEKKQNTLLSMSDAIENIVTWTTMGLDWEKNLAHSKDGSDEQLELVRAGRIATSNLWKSMQSIKIVTADDKALLDKASFDVATLVRMEITALEAAKNRDDVDKLRADYADILNMKEPQLEPDTEMFIRRSKAPVGPLQKIDACYRMKMPEAGRLRLVQLLTKMRADAISASKEVDVKSDIALVPKRMTEYIFEVMYWEEASTAEFTKDQYFPAAALTTFNESVQLTKSTYDAISKIKADEQMSTYLLQSKEKIDQLIGYEKRAVANVANRAQKPSSTSQSTGADWRGASVVTGQQLEICHLVNEFYQAMAKEDVKRLNEVLVAGPQYADPESIVAYIVKARTEGKIESIQSYSVAPDTEYRILRNGDEEKVLVTGLLSKISVNGSIVSGTKSGLFTVVQTKNGLRLGFPKNVLMKPVPKLPATQATTKSVGLESQSNMHLP